MIIPHSSVCTDRMSKVIDLLTPNKYWISFYDVRPSKLFDGADQRLAIFIAHKVSTGARHWTSKYHRWNPNSRKDLFNNIRYAELLGISPIQNSIPKINSTIEYSIIDKVCHHHKLITYESKNSGKSLYYHNAPRYWIRATNYIPYFINDKGCTISTQIKRIDFNNDIPLNNSLLTVNSSLFYFWFIAFSDCRHLNNREIDNMPILSNKINTESLTSLMIDYQMHKKRKETFYKATGKVIYDEYYPKLSKPIIDEIDKLLAKHYGFTEEELDFIINYDIKYRMGEELNKDEE